MGLAPDGERSTERDFRGAAGSAPAAWWWEWRLMPMTQAVNRRGHAETCGHAEDDRGGGRAVFGTRHPCGALRSRVVVQLRCGRPRASRVPTSRCLRASVRILLIQRVSPGFPPTR
jgi:hypothetical protein